MAAAGDRLSRLARDIPCREIGTYLLEQECRSWHAGADGRPVDLELARRTVSVLTLLGSTSEDEAAAVLRRVPDLEDANEERRRALARWVHRLYPSRLDGQWVGKLEPDLLAHALHAAVLGDAPHLAGLLVDPKPSAAQTARALHALIPGLAAFSQLAPVVQEVLRASPFRTLPQAITTAFYLDDVRGADVMLADFLRANPPAEIVLDGIEPLLHGRLRLTQVAIAKLRVDYAQAAGDTPRIAAALVSSARALRSVNYNVEAEAQATKAVELYRELNLVGPIYRREEGEALGVLGSALDGTGQYREALTATEEAVCIYRELSSDYSAAHSSDLAEALWTWAVALHRMSLFQEARAAVEEAVDLYRELDRIEPGRSRPGLAGALRTLAVALVRLGFFREALAAAEEAVDLHRELDVVNPAKHRLQLARTVQNLASALDHMGRYPEARAAAEEAVRLWADLERIDSGQRLSDWAGALRTLAVALDREGRHQQALVTAEEAVRQYRDLERINPAVHRHNLAGALQTVALVLGHLERHADALVVIEAAVKLHRQLGHDNSSAPPPDWALVLRIQAIELAWAGRYGEALAATQESVRLYRDLDRVNPAVHRPQLARTLRVIGSIQEQDNRPDGAFASYQEAAQLFQEIAAEWPEIYSAEHADTQRRLRDLRLFQGNQH